VKLISDTRYYPFGPPSHWTYGDNRILTRSHDLSYRPTLIQDKAPDGLDALFDYDSVGNVSKIQSTDAVANPPVTIDYDSLNRLIAFKDGLTNLPIEAYSYDATGNRTSLTNAGGTQGYTYAASSHRLQSVDGADRRYNPNGDTTEIDGSMREFTYDARNRLINVISNGSPQATYEYNAKGERVYSRRGAAAHHSIYDEQGQWLGDYDETGAPLQQVIRLDEMPVALLVGGAGSSTRLHYIEPDHLGTPRAVFEAKRDVAV
jgi:YD repeat-containing protein